MTTSKPKIRRVYITATDAETRKSLRGTLYDTTPDQVLKLVGIDRKPIRKKRIRAGNADSITTSAAKGDEEIRRSF